MNKLIILVVHIPLDSHSGHVREPHERHVINTHTHTKNVPNTHLSIGITGFIWLVSYFKCISVLASVVRRQWGMLAVNISAKHRYLIY